MAQVAIPTASLRSEAVVAGARGRHAPALARILRERMDDWLGKGKSKDLPDE
jgi:hypothetical protein